MDETETVTPPPGRRTRQSPDVPGHSDAGDDAGEVSDPIGLLRIASMLKKVDDQLGGLELDAGAASRLEEMAQEVRSDLTHTVSPRLVAELDRLLPQREEDGGSPPSPAESVLTHAQLVGWVDGVVQGLQLQAVASRLHAAPLPPAPSEPEPSRGSSAYL